MSVTVCHSSGSVGDGMRRWVNPPFCGLSACQTNEKHLRFSSACLSPYISLLRALFFVRCAAIRRSSRNCCRFFDACFRIVRRCWRERLSLMLGVSGGCSWMSLGLSIPWSRPDIHI